MNPSDQFTGPQFQGSQAAPSGSAFGGVNNNQTPPQVSGVPPVGSLQSAPAFTVDPQPSTVAPDGTGPMVEQTIAQARAAIAQTVNDPRAQVQAIESIKAAYIQSRYGKVIKVTGSQQ